MIIDNLLIANKVSGIESNDKSIKKYEKLSKTRKLFESQKLAKLRKKLSQNRNLLKFDIKENNLSFFTLEAKITFNCL